MYGVIRKAQPTMNDVHANRPLTNMSIAYIQDQSNFVADKIFPMVPVDKKSDSYYIYTQADWYRDEARKRAPGTESDGSGYSLSTDTYNCDIWAFHKDVDDPTRANTDAPLDPDIDANEFVTQRLLISRERQFASTYFTSSVWGTDTTPTNLWSDFANSDPVGNVTTGIRTIQVNTGFKPNVLLLGAYVYDALKQHPDLIERIKYTNAVDKVGTDWMAKIFDVQRVIVGEAIYNTTAEGATASYSHILGKHALLAYVEPRPTIRKPSAGYTFGWRGYTQNPMGIKIRKFRMENLNSDRIEGELAYDMKKVAANLGYFFASVVS